jgi:hypothetical protein
MYWKSRPLTLRSLSRLRAGSQQVIRVGFTPLLTLFKNSVDQSTGPTKPLAVFLNHEHMLHDHIQDIVEVRATPLICTQFVDKLLDSVRLNLL